LKGILHLAAPFVQKLYNTSSHGSLPQKHHTTENPLKRVVDNTSFEKNCELFVSGKWLNFDDLWKDFPGSFNILLPQVIPNGERYRSVVFEDTFHHGKSYYKLVNCSNASSHKNISFYNLRVYNEQ
jgi:hypothetical protein